jgi:hypothetical protein
MTREDINQAAWRGLVARHGQVACPVCRNTDWQVGATLRAATVGRGETQERLVVPVICQVCGYTLTFDHQAMVTVRG